MKIGVKCILACLLYTCNAYGQYAGDMPTYNRRGYVPSPSYGSYGRYDGYVPYSRQPLRYRNDRARYEIREYNYSALRS